MFLLCLLALLGTATLAFWPLDRQAPNPARAAALALLMLGSALTALALAALTWWSSLSGTATWRASLVLAVVTSACAAKGLLRHRPAPLALAAHTVRR
ncbi:MAG: hypothetical protein RR100_27050 [Comamonas sp.]